MDTVCHDDFRGVKCGVAIFLKVYGANMEFQCLLEGQWYLFSAVFLLGAGYTLYKDKHVRVDVMYSRLSKSGQRRINLIGTLIFAIPFCVLGIWSSLEFVSNSWSILEQSPDAGGLPRYPVKTLIPLGFALLLVQCLVWLRNLDF